MTDEDLFDRLASLVGIEPFYFGIFEGRLETSLETKTLTLSAPGFDNSSAQALRTAALAIEEEPWREGIAPVVVQYEDEAGIDLDLFPPADGAGRSWMWQIACENGEEVNGTFQPEDLPVRGARDIEGRCAEQRRLRLQQLLPIGLQAPRRVSATARRYGISRSLLLQWRRTFRFEQRGIAEQQIGFVPAMVVRESEPAVPAPAGLAGGGAIEVEFATGYTNMRRGFPSLALQVPEILHRDPLCGHLYCFRGRRGNLLKVIWHDGQGACLFTKRLQRGRFLWPGTAGDAVTISSAQLGYLLSGIDWRNPQETWRPTSVG